MKEIGLHKVYFELSIWTDGLFFCLIQSVIVWMNKEEVEVIVEVGRN